MGSASTLSKNASTVDVPDDVAIFAQSLTKSYGENGATQTVTQAVKGIDLSIKNGEIFGLIGPDGAGKTSTFHILGGVMEPTSGVVLVAHSKPRDGRMNIGYLTQQFSLYLDLSVEENLQYIAGLREVSAEDFAQRKDRYLRSMDLARFKERLAGQLSGGMKQKLALCCALIARPKVLLLDEPTTGVDPVSRREFWDLLAGVSAEGLTIAVATPYLDEAERCNRIALMHAGAIQQVGTPAELKASLNLTRLEVRGANLQANQTKLIQALSGAKDTVADVQTFGDRLDVLVSDKNVGQAKVEEAALKLSINKLQLTVEEPTLENVFVLNLREGGAKKETEHFPFTKKEERKEEKNSHSSAIRAVRISKRFAEFQAVNQVSLNVNYGEIYGLLGANGAGKTTTIKMLCGLLAPSAGTMELAGHASDLRNPRLRQRIGYMSQKFTLYNDLSIIENLEYYSGVYEVPEKYRKDRIRWALSVSDLANKEKLMVGSLPGGWKQRVAFAACIMHEPEIVFLDEPTSGVDPVARRQLWELIDDLAANGTAVLVTTHFLEEAEHCHQLGFMVAGEVVAQGSPSQIKSSQPGKLIEIVPEASDLQSASNLLKQQLDNWRVSIFANRLHIVLDHPETELPKVREELSNNQVKLLSVKEVPFSLEDAFIGIVERANKS